MLENLRPTRVRCRTAVLTNQICFQKEGKNPSLIASGNENHLKILLFSWFFLEFLIKIREKWIFQKFQKSSFFQLQCTSKKFWSSREISIVYLFWASVPPLMLRNDAEWCTQNAFSITKALPENSRRTPAGRLPDVGRQMKSTNRTLKREEKNPSLIASGN